MSTPSLPEHPSRPKLIVRVGVTGHRWNKLKRRDLEAIEQRFHTVFESIENVVDEIYQDDHAGYRSPKPGEPPPPKPILRILSGLAEGTDRIGAKAARSRQRPWLLTAMLPFSKAGYLQDFVLREELPDGTEVPFPKGETGHKIQDSKSVLEFEELYAAAALEGGVQVLDGNPELPGGYRQLATALCLNSDVVVAVWDGEPASPGGTGDIVRLAREQGIPVVRIPLNGIDNPWLYDPSQENEGRGEGLLALEEHFRRLLVAPRPPAKGKHADPDSRERYFAETARSMGIGGLYDWFFNLLAPSRSRPSPRGAARESNRVDALRSRWEQEWKAQGASAELCRALSNTDIHGHYAWASHLASYYAGRYRSAFLANYMLSWIAVGAAAIGAAFHLARDSKGTLYSTGVEVFLLTCIVLIVVQSQRHKLHARWLQYRRLAEWIRLLPMLLPLSRTPVLGVESNPLLVVRESWVDWMLRAIVREAGVLPINLPEQMNGARGILAQGVLQGQIAYHERTARWNARIDKILHRLAGVTFVVALLLAFANLGSAVWEAWFLETWFSEGMAKFLLVATLVLPALGAALHGLRSQGEYEETALRSTRIMERLQDLLDRLEKQKVPTVGTVADIATLTASAMSTELSAWFIAYQNKGISPA